MAEKIDTPDTNDAQALSEWETLIAEEIDGIWDKIQQPDNHVNNSANHRPILNALNALPEHLQSEAKLDLEERIAKQVKTLTKGLNELIEAHQNSLYRLATGEMSAEERAPFQEILDQAILSHCHGASFHQKKKNIKLFCQHRERRLRKRKNTSFSIYTRHSWKRNRCTFFP
jgi:hypothetical protein